jgi:hypothetical protein
MNADGAREHFSGQHGRKTTFRVGAIVGTPVRKFPVPCPRLEKSQMSINRRLFANIKALVKTPSLYIGSLLFSHRETDFERWRNPQNLSSMWDERTKLMAEMIPASARVIEFGAGNMVLQKYLAPDCSYQPSDLVKRADNTLVVDLNEGFPELLERYDYAVLSGVIEYILDVDRLFEWLGSICENIVFSYAVLDKLSDPVTRARHGWLNSYTDEEILLLVKKARFDLIGREYWGEHHIYHCKRPKIQTNP